MAPDIKDIFKDYEDYLKIDQGRKEKIKSIEKQLWAAANHVTQTLQKIHDQDGVSQEKIKQICKDARESIYKNVRPRYQDLDELLNPKKTNDYYHYHHEGWKFVTQRMVYFTALIVYLETGKLINWDESAEILGITVNRQEGFHLDLEDFLFGLLQLGPDLARFAKTSVTHDINSQRPHDILKFMKNLNSGFSQLHSKSDPLRKKFESMRYDIGKVEDVIYDLQRPERTLEDKVDALLKKKLEALDLKKFEGVI